MPSQELKARSKLRPATGFSCFFPPYRGVRVRMLDDVATGAPGQYVEPRMRRVGGRGLNRHSTISRACERNRLLFDHPR